VNLMKKPEKNANTFVSRDIAGTKSSPGYSSQTKIIGLIICAAMLWMASGLFKSDKAVVKPNEVLTEVRVLVSNGSKEKVYFDASGVVDSKNKVLLYPEVAGNVKKITAKDGDRLRKDDPIIEIEVRDRESKLQHAKANLEAERMNYNSAKMLHNKGLTSANYLSKAKAAFESAEAEYENSAIKQRNNIIRAPFDGFIDKINVSVGDLR
jgi:multidrug efflux system membrane fusion protein